jgi:hypothetical protein
LKEVPPPLMSDRVWPPAPTRITALAGSIVGTGPELSIV